MTLRSRGQCGRLTPRPLRKRRKSNFCAQLVSLRCLRLPRRVVTAPSRSACACTRAGARSTHHTHAIIAPTTSESDTPLTRCHLPCARLLSSVRNSFAIFRNALRYRQPAPAVRSLSKILHDYIAITTLLQYWKEDDDAAAAASRKASCREG